NRVAAFSDNGLSFSIGTLDLVCVEAITSIPFATVAQYVAGDPLAPAGGVSIEQLTFPKSFFSYIQPCPLSVSYMLFIQSSNCRVLIFVFGTFMTESTMSPPGTLHEHALIPVLPGMSPSACSPTFPTAAPTCASVRKEHGCKELPACAATCEVAINIRPVTARTVTTFG